MACPIALLTTTTCLARTPLGGILSFRKKAQESPPPSYPSSSGSKIEPVVWRSSAKPSGAGPKLESAVLRSCAKPSSAEASRGDKPSGWEGGLSRALVVTEGMCLVVAGASYTSSVISLRRNSLVVSTSIDERKFLEKTEDLISGWYVPALWAALVINAILRSVQSWRTSSTAEAGKALDQRGVQDLALDQRIGRLEGDLRGLAGVAQVLARHLEKLGVRFRVTRRTLRDPIKEVAELARKASDVATALASRGDRLEQELRETQRALVSIQGQQEKQLELLVTAVTTTLASQKALEKRLKSVKQQHASQAATDLLLLPELEHQVC